MAIDISSSPIPHPLRRSALLSLLLGLLTIAALLALLAKLSVWHRLIFLYPHWAAYTFVTIAVVRLPAIMIVWRWSRSGVVAYFCLQFGNFVTCAVVGTASVGVPGIAGAIGLAALVRPMWKQMPWWIVESKPSSS